MRWTRDFFGTRGDPSPRAGRLAGVSRPASHGPVTAGTCLRGKVVPVSHVRMTTGWVEWAIVSPSMADAVTVHGRELRS